MDYIISDRKLCKVLDPLSIVGFLLFLFFLFLAKDIGLCDHGKFDQGILKSFSGMAVHYHDLTRIYYLVIILPVNSGQLLILQILCQTLCPCAGTGK